MSTGNKFHIQPLFTNLCYTYFRKNNEKIINRAKEQHINKAFEGDIKINNVI